MKNVSNQFRNELFNGNRNFIKSADIKLKDDTVLHVDNSKLWQNGLKIEDSVSNSSSFDIGSAIIGQLTVTLNNIYDEYSNYDFTNAEISNIKVGLKLPDDTIESLSYGIYTVNETKYNGSFITLTAYDNLYKFDVSYSKSTLSYPATLGEIVRDACSVCNVQLGTATFDNDDFLVNERPSDDSITFRNVLLWVAQISCKFLKVDAYGKLLLSWYNTGIFESIKIISGGKFRPWETDVTYDGGSFSPWTEGDITIDGGNFSDGNFHNIYNWSSFPNITTDDVIITGIKVTDEVETDDGKEEVTYQSGEEGYILSIEDNKLIQGKGEIVCSYLGEKLIGLTFRPFSGNCLSDPTVEAGDLAIISDRKGNSYKTFITSNTFQPGNFQSLSCNAETPLRNSVSRFSKLTQALVDNRKEIQKQKTEWQKAMEDLSNRINNSSGLYMTSEEQTDGSSIYYMHDKPTLEESMIVWKMTAEAVAVSTDGGKTYNAGLTVDGTLIANIMNTIGINFDWGVGGSLVIKDSDGNINFMADANTGRVYISPSALGYDEDKDLILNGNFEDGSSENWTFNTGKIVRSGTIYCANLSYSDSFVESRPILQQSLKNAIPGTYRLSFMARLVANTEGATIRTTLGKNYEHSFAGFTQAFKDFTYDFQITEENIVAGSINLTFQNTSDSYCEIYVTGIMLYPPLVESLKNNISITADGLSAEIERATGEEEVLRSSIEANAQQIKLKVSAGDVESIIEQNADSIRLKAGKISWESTYSSMTENGQLTCTSAEIKGIFRSEQKNSWGTEYIQIRDAIIRGGVDSAEYGLLDLSAQYEDGAKHVSLSCQKGTVNVLGKTLSFETVDNTGKIILGGKVNCIYGFNGDLAVNANMDYTIKVEGGIITGWY